MVEAIYKAGDETITLVKFGPDDYGISFHNADCSVRGTLLDVWKEINEAFEIETLEEIDINEI